ncbi:MAG: bifunctional precorrin-2 dehydrogenase/sirohydrochlorin ferrochelatase [Thermodesulfobacteriota bacterium]
MRPYALMMDIDGKPATVVGGGMVALRKVTSLLECDARVTVVSPELVPELRRLADKGEIRWIEARFEPTRLDQDPRPVLVFGTTDRRDVNVATYRAAVERGIPCNIADVPDLCTFTVPATASRGDLLIAVSTGGASPALARRIREQLERHFGPEYATFTRIMAGLRKAVLATGRNSDENKALFLRIVDSDVLDALRQNDRERVVSRLRDLLPPEIDPEPIVHAALAAQVSESRGIDEKGR